VDRGQPLSLAQTGLVLVKATLFLFGALGLGVVLSPRLFALASRLRGQDVLLAVALAACFVLAYLASAIGLAAIVGAYAAGLILEDVHFKDFTERGERHLRELIAPIASFLVPVFFVLMGLKVDLRAFAHPEVLGLAALLIVAAIAGKQACALGAVGGGLDRLSVGIGMIPRGEVGLIFASIGSTLTIAGQPVVTPSVFAAVVIMVVVTTLVTPPALSWSLGRGARHASGAH
jgi:Kef-type K+ transport system membrane component KefB